MYIMGKSHLIEFVCYHLHESECYHLHESECYHLIDRISSDIT